MTQIQWIAENDGWGIVGYSFVCPNCGAWNRFVHTDDSLITCKYCLEELENPGDPEA